MIWLDFFATLLASTILFYWLSSSYGLDRPLRALFIFSCVVSSGLIRLILFQISVDPKSIDKQDISSTVWQALIVVQLPLLALILPAVHIYALASRTFPFPRFAFIILFGIYAVLFAGGSSRFFPVNYSASFEIQWQAFRQAMLAVVSIAGVAIMATVGGISSVSSPYMAFFHSQAPITESTLQKLSSSIQHTEDQIQQQELQVNRLRLDVKNRMRKSSTNLMAKVLGVVRPDEATVELNETQMELSSLMRLRAELIAERISMEQQFKERRQSATIQGRVKHAFFSVFSLYCIYRVFTSFARLFWWSLDMQGDAGKNPPRDALVLAIATRAHSRRPDISMESWARVIATLMSLMVIIGSINGVSKLLRKLWSKFNRGADSIHANPIFASHVFGIYSVALATVMQLNLPKGAARTITAALDSPLTVNFIQLLNDIVLCTAGVLTLGVSVIIVWLARDQERDEELAEKFE